MKTREELVAKADEMRRQLEAQAARSSELTPKEINEGYRLIGYVDALTWMLSTEPAQLSA